MKRYFALVSLVLALGLLFGCAANPGITTPPESVPQEPTDLPQPAPDAGNGIAILDILSERTQELYANRDTRLPVAVVYSFYGEGGGFSSPLYGEDAVNTVLDGILALKVTGTTEEMVTDYDSGYSFYYEDGTYAGGISFNYHNVESKNAMYTVEDPSNAFPGVRFPGTSRFDALLSDGPDPLLVEFSDRCQSEMPQSVTVRITGQEDRVIAQSEEIVEILNLLYAESISSPWKIEDDPQTVYELVFTMDDGAEYPLRFSDYQYLYTFPEPLGTWGYYMDDFDLLTELLDRLT